MPTTSEEAPSTWYSRNRLPRLAIIALILFMPRKWTGVVFAAVFAGLAIQGVLNAAITLVRTRWYFRVGSDLINAALAAAIIWGSEQILVLLGLVVMLLAWSWFSDLTEKRRYPKHVMAFKHAHLASGRWGWLFFRQIPWMRNSAAE